MAANYYSLGNYAAAEPLYQRALSIWEKAVGLEHPFTAQGMENYAGLLREMGTDAVGGGKQRPYT